MLILAWPAAALAWLGRHGTRAVAVSIFVSLVVPQLSAVFKPFVTEAILGLLVLAFLRVEPRELQGYFRHPLLVALATMWIMVITPLVLGSIFVALGLRESSPGLFLALIFQASAAPIMSATAFAALMGLDAALSLATLMACIAATPFTTPLFVYIFASTSFVIPPLQLGVKLFFLLAGSAALAWAVRKVAGGEWVVRQKQRIDGLNVITLLAFAIALMDGVAALLWTRPLFVLGLIGLTFAIALGGMAITALVFWRAGRSQSLALGWSTANRNMGLMLAAMGGVLPAITWLYMGLAQFPIYLLPLLLQPLVRRIIRKR